MYSLIIYKELSNPYMRIIRIADGGIVAADGWSISKTTAWGASDITLTKNDLIGGIPITISGDLEAGDYDILLYDNGTPADTDVVEIGRRIAWTGSMVMGLPVSV